MSEQTGKERLDAIDSDLTSVTEDLRVARGFVGLIRTLEKMSGMGGFDYDQGASRYRAVSNGRPISELELQLEEFFGPPKKRSENPLPVKLGSHPIFEYLQGEVEKQSLFFRKSENGLFYGSLEPMQEPYGAVLVRVGFARKKKAGSKKGGNPGIALQDIGLPAQSLEERIAEQLNDGSGLVNGVGLATFLLEAELEKSSTSIRVASKEQSGYLFLKNGVLIDASCGALSDRDAATEILSWTDTVVELESPVERDEDLLGQPLIRTLTAALKKRNTRAQSPEESPGAEQEAAAAAEDADPPKKKKKARKKRTGRKKAQKGLFGVRPVYATALAVVLLGAGGFFGFRYWQEQRRQAAFAEVTADAAAEKDVEEAVSLLTAFIEAGPKDEYAQRAADAIVRHRSAAEKRLFEEVVAEVEALEVKPGIEAKAEEIYRQYLDRYPQGRYAKEVLDRLGSLADLAEQRLFQEAAETASQDPAAKVAAYRRYLKSFPEGRRADEARRRIADLAAEQSRELETSMRSCELEGRWEPCLGLIDEFVAVFGSASQSPDLRHWREKAQGKVDMADLNALVESLRQEPEALGRALRRFIEKRPESPAAEKARSRLAAMAERLEAERLWGRIEAAARDENRPLPERIVAVRDFADNVRFDDYRSAAVLLAAELEERQVRETLRRRQERAEQARREQLAQQRRQLEGQRRRIEALEREAAVQLAGSGGRFVPQNGGTFVDTRTGLVWSLLDSQSVLSRCRNYRDANRYVEEMTTGNRRDWRLPTAAELAGLYKNPPFFPGESAPWYWTSKVFTTGYHTKVRVVTSTRENEFKTEYRRAEECGAVRAVRDPG